MKSIADGVEATGESLAGYDPCERCAILEHKYFLGIEMGFDPGVQCAVASWEKGYAMRWRQQRHEVECQAQMAQIELHRVHLSTQCGYEVPWDAAARDWILQYAAQWRASRDCQLVE